LKAAIGLRQRWRIALGWLPAVILPSATIVQVRALLTAPTHEGTSLVTWLLFLLANVGALFLGRPDTTVARVQMALAFGLTALLDAAVVALLLR
jgi:hypothetical protein